MDKKIMDDWSAKDYEDHMGVTEEQLTYLKMHKLKDSNLPAGIIEELKKWDVKDLYDMRDFSALYNMHGIGKGKVEKILNWVSNNHGYLFHYQDIKFYTEGQFKQILKDGAIFTDRKYPGWRQQSGVPETIIYSSDSKESGDQPVLTLLNMHEQTKDQILIKADKINRKVYRRVINTEFKGYKEYRKNELEEEKFKEEWIDSTMTKNFGKILSDFEKKNNYQMYEFVYNNWIKELSDEAEFINKRLFLKPD